MRDLTFKSHLCALILFTFISSPFLVDLFATLPPHMLVLLLLLHHLLHPSTISALDCNTSGILSLMSSPEGWIERAGERGRNRDIDKSGNESVLLVEGASCTGEHPPEHCLSICLELKHGSWQLSVLLCVGLTPFFMDSRGRKCVVILRYYSSPPGVCYLESLDPPSPSLTAACAWWLLS